MFKKVLIANRGEIAVRIVRACRELGVRSVAVYSDVDRAALHVRLADEAYPIGPAPSSESYLVIEKILGVARYALATRFIPATASSRKIPRCHARAARPISLSSAHRRSNGATRLENRRPPHRQCGRRADGPRHARPHQRLGELADIARKIGFPVILKAVAGGGGKGMRSVERESDLASAWRDASSEAQNAFGDGRMYLEKYLERPRHIEIQILADQHGHTVYLGERECSVQRRHQKVIEEAPRPS